MLEPLLCMWKACDLIPNTLREREKQRGADIGCREEEGRKNTGCRSFLLGVVVQPDTQNPKTN